jgi:hypothetical protein
MAETESNQLDIYTPESVFEAVEKLKFYLSCEAELYLNIGKMLCVLTEAKRYKLYGSHIETKDDFLKEVGLKRSTAYVYMDVWKTFGKHLESTKLTVPYRRLIEALPVAKTDELAIEWIHKAEALLPTDYKAEVHKAKTGVDDLECDHSDTEPYLKCRKCGKWLHG